MGLAQGGHAAAPPETVVVTGTRMASPLQRLVGDVVVIDAQALRDSAADSLEELLARVGGVQMSRNGGPGQSASALVRGASATAMVVLVDGVRVGAATVGQTDLAQFSLSEFERIEILRGAGSSLYGADAVGGVVNLITRSAGGAPQIRAHAAVGGLGSSELGAGFSQRSGPWSLALNASREASTGVSALKPNDRYGLYNPDADGFVREGASVRGGFEWGQGQRVQLNWRSSRLNSQFDSAEYPAPTFAPTTGLDFRNRLNTQVLALDYRLPWSAQWAFTAKASQQVDDLTSGANERAHYRTDRRAQQLQAEWTPAPQQQWVLAAERLVEAMASTDYSAPARSTLAWVVAYQGQFGAQRVQADWRQDRLTTQGLVRTGKLGWALDLNAVFTARALAATAFRAPAFNELYYPGYGVPGLRPEQSRNLELGLNARLVNGSVGATWYRNRVSDLIGFQDDPSQCPVGDTFGCAANVSRALLQGLTLNAEQQWGPWHATAALDFLDAKDQDTGARLTRRAAHQQSVGVDWTQGPWFASAAVQRVGARPEGGQSLAAYATVDLKARWRWAPAWALETKLLNATQRRYEPVLDSPGAPRTFWLGLRYEGGVP